MLTRGVWLAFFEVVVNRMMWMFNFDLHQHGAGVFWAIGWSMVALSLLVYLPTRVVTAFGVAMIGTHNLHDALKPADVPLPGWVWTVLHHPGEATVVDGYTFGTGYCLIPWVGVMAAGYGFGTVLLLDRAARRKWLTSAKVRSERITTSGRAGHLVKAHSLGKNWYSPLITSVASLASPHFGSKSKLNVPTTAKSMFPAWG